jgi:hypothetical protein
MRLIIPETYSFRFIKYQLKFYYYSTTSDITVPYNQQGYFYSFQTIVDIKLIEKSLRHVRNLEILNPCQ